MNFNRISAARKASAGTWSTGGPEEMVIHCSSSSEPSERRVEYVGQRCETRQRAKSLQFLVVWVLVLALPCTTQAFSMPWRSVVRTTKDLPLSTKLFFLNDEPNFGGNIGSLEKDSISCRRRRRRQHRRTNQLATSLDCNANNDSMDSLSRGHEKQRTKLGSPSHVHGFSSSSKRSSMLKWASRQKSSLLRSKKKDLDEEEDNENNDNGKVRKAALDFLVVHKAIGEAWDRVWETALAAVPESVRQTCQVVMEFLLNLRWIAASFVAGTIFAGAALLVPIYNQIETLNKPVTLFETILSDLEAGYVDPVDTNKLFETGVSAMLRSLDPYTEYEGPQEAVELNESIDGKYGGVGLVITGNNKPIPIASAKTLPTVPSKTTNKEGSTLEKPKPISSAASETGGVLVALETEDEEGEEFDEDDVIAMKEEQRLRARAQQQGIRVVNAFENYAFDYGMRVGDKLVAIDNEPITSETTVEGVRDRLRGEPGTLVSISFERDGVAGVQTVTMPRSVVRIRDVKLATLIGNPKEGIGYVQLSGFASETGREMRNAIHYLQRAAEDASDGSHSLQALVLDLRGNPGGLLTSAVDVASLLVPKGSDIVSAKGRGFPGILYRSRVDPILDPSTKLAVLVNRGTASAAEIVSGAVQDLDVGIIVGADRTFGKGLVQNVEELPFNSALKFTVAKYYTPSGRCIQGINYKEGGGLREEDGRYTANKIAKKDRSIYFTKNGRIVRDGGGIEADFKVDAPKASALEVTLLRSGVLGEFAAEWSKKNELTNNFKVDEDTYRSFQSFVMARQRSGDLELDALYKKPLDDLKKTLKLSGYKGSEREVEALQASIIRDIQRDFEKYRKDIKEDISQSILARYMPESMLIERGVKSDTQVAAAVKLLQNQNRFNKVLSRETKESIALPRDATYQSASSSITTSSNEDAVRGRVDL